MFDRQLVNRAFSRARANTGNNNSYNAWFTQVGGATRLMSYADGHSRIVGEVEINRTWGYMDPIPAEYIKGKAPDPKRN